MIYLFFGPDGFRAREEVRALGDKLDTDGNLALNTLWLEGASVTVAELRNATQTASFFAEARLVIVDNLLARSGGRRSRRGQESSSADLDDFLDVLAAVPASTIVVLLEEKEPPKAALAALQGQATIQQFAPLKGEELRRWARERIKGLGADFSPGALQRLLSLIDAHHLAELANEIDKLATYAHGRQVLQEDVDALVSAAVQMQTWDLTDAVIEGRQEKAMAVLRAMNARDHPAQLLIFMIIRQFRQILLAQAFSKEKMSSAQIGEELGIRSPYPLQKAIEQAGVYPADRLETAYRKLLRTDVAVKTGVLDAETALEALVVELCGLRPQEARRRS